MDGASVVGLIAATIQLAGFTVGVVQRLKSFLDATKDVPQVVQVLHQRLPLLIYALEKTSKQIEGDELPLSQVPGVANIVLSRRTHQIDESLGRLATGLVRRSHRETEEGA